MSLLATPVFARDADPLHTDAKRLAVALHQLKALDRNSAPWSRVKPLLLTLVEEDSKHASRYVVLARRKCSLDQTASKDLEVSTISSVALNALREQVITVLAQIDSLNSDRPPGTEPPNAPLLWAMLAWARREIAEIQNSLDA
jgi:hypothetical protein